ncbi:lytic transglycosylase domain-containing protein [uncultured Sphingomonas sp.]|uniref:lytic transglycosylase domain-containing protein n=1 Tax=uncultured Sphingomonas sp. TaxID=158754 RepID=UPI0035CBB79B
MTVNAITATRIQSAIALASSRTGIDFDYLLGQAKLESGLDATARAGTSSATGLYQFIEQSWLAVVKKHGAEHGMGWAADSIGRGANGRLSVADPGTRQAILNLRNDPAAASLMAAEHAGDNKAALEGRLGREATGTDLYMAHFLGLGGASKFLSRMQAEPDATGAALFPAAARANRNVFYDRGGAPRSLTRIYERFAAKLEGGAAGASGSTSPVGYASQALELELDGGTVITGAESATDALAWANTTLGRFGKPQAGTATAASLMRPTPDTARLAYMMLASMGA